MAFSSSEPTTGLGESANSNAICWKNWVNILKSELPWRKNAPKKPEYSMVHEFNRVTFLYTAAVTCTSVRLNVLSNFMTLGRHSVQGCKTFSCQPSLLGNSE
ncbi:hypothetical protein PoB_003342100 [Plakobranchus ocellatus]|uniref:Uncharacterized protein n=1 Tax=Plakobranchus ocellatus TaxID=259542 RepID=A0AAV4AJZ0_9GAST|nr:hypothetical protein PoB_003342100 [Plakobranchus ocellatus]